MDIPAVQNLVNATHNPMGPVANDASSITAQSTEPIASGGQSASGESDFGSNHSKDFEGNLGSNLNEKA